MVCWKGFTAELDTWEGRENLKNAKEAIKEFEREYWQDMEDVTKQECKKGTFRRGELPGRFMARKLFGWSDKSTTKNTGEDWKGIGDDGKGDDKEEEEPWKW